jgi:hypothetical protein
MAKKAISLWLFIGLSIVCHEPLGAMSDVTGEDWLVDG